MDEFSWLTDVTDDEIRAELPESVQELVDLIGLQPTLKLLRHYGGLSIYLRKPDQVFRGLRDRRIRAEFTGSNYAALARQYRLTESRVRDIIADRCDYRQSSMFEG